MSLRILYLDKNIHHHNLFGQALKPLNYSLSYADSSRSALDRIATTLFDLVAIRSDMEPVGAIEFIKTIQQWPQTPLILVLTQPGNEPIAAEALEEGALTYMMVDDQGAWLTILPVVIRQIMQRHQSDNEKRELLFNLQGRNQALSYLNLVGADLTSTLESEQVMTRLMRYAIEVLGAEGSSVWLWTDEHQTHLECEAIINRQSTPPLKGFRMDASQGVIGWAGRKNRTVLVNDVYGDERFNSKVDQKFDFTTHALLSVPLRVRGKALGVLNFVNKLVGQFDDKDQSLAETLAHSAAIAVENARLIESLHQSKSVLEERNAELDAFGHTVAHDLQNMLARIVGFSEYLLQETELINEASIADSSIANAVEVIARDSRKMGLVIEALMLLSASRDARIDIGPVNTHYVINEALSRLTDQIGSVEATIDYPESWPTALAFSPWVEEVWYNYLGNALKYGGAPPKIHLGATIQPDKGMVQFWIQDNGEGVPEELRSELFRPFTDYGRNRKVGAGLGLSIVQRLVTRMNGVVGVDNRPKGGSCFWFTLPIYSGPDEMPE